MNQHQGTKDAIRDFVPGEMKVMKCDDDTLTKVATAFVTSIYTQTELLASCADDVLDVYLEGDESTRSMLGCKFVCLFLSDIHVNSYFPLSKSNGH